jgi:hypothetical protein
MAKIKQKEYTIHVKRDVLFEAKIKAASIDEAFGFVKGMSAADLWDSPGEVIDDSHAVVAVFE